MKNSVGQRKGKMVSIGNWFIRFWGLRAFLLIKPLHQLESVGENCTLFLVLHGRMLAPPEAIRNIKGVFHRVIVQRLMQLIISLRVDFSLQICCHFARL